MPRILFDQSVPFPLIRHLTGYQVETAYWRGWDRLKNGELLNAIEAAGFDVFLTADQNLRYQRNLSGRRIAIVVIGTNFWPMTAAIALLLLQRSRMRNLARSARCPIRSRCGQNLSPELH